MIDPADPVTRSKLGTRASDRARFKNYGSNHLAPCAFTRVQRSLKFYAPLQDKTMEYCIEFRKKVLVDETEEEKCPKN